MNFSTLDDYRPRINGITEKVIGCAHRVSNELGVGFLEKVYENALALEVRDTGLYAIQQGRMDVRYKGRLVGDFVADIIVERCVIVEVKAVKKLEEIHFSQCLNYLRGTGLHICLLVNFGLPKAIIRRVVSNF